MRIKRRVISWPVSNQEICDAAADGGVVKEDSPFNFEIKPKLPLPTPKFTGFGRRLGSLVLSCSADTGDSSADAEFNAGDYVQMIRIPLDSKNNTEVRYRNRIRNRATGIVAKCVDCAGTRKNVTECAAVDCPLWSFRLGGSPFRRRK